MSLAPNYAFDWTGEADGLTLFVDQDTTLFVLGPDGSVTCKATTPPADNLNPTVTLEQPAEGRYLVWVGRLDPTTSVDAVLTITEDAKAQPNRAAAPAATRRQHCRNTRL